MCSARMAHTSTIRLSRGLSPLKPNQFRFQVRGLSLQGVASNSVPTISFVFQSSLSPRTESVRKPTAKNSVKKEKKRSVFRESAVVRKRPKTEQDIFRQVLPLVFALHGISLSGFIYFFPSASALRALPNCSLFFPRCLTLLSELTSDYFDYFFFVIVAMKIVLANGPASGTKPTGVSIFVLIFFLSPTPILPLLPLLRPLTSMRLFVKIYIYISCIAQRGGRAATAVANAAPTRARARVDVAQRTQQARRRGALLEKSRKAKKVIVRTECTKQRGLGGNSG